MVASSVAPDELVVVAAVALVVLVHVAEELLAATVPDPAVPDPVSEEAEDSGGPS